MPNEFTDACLVIVFLTVLYMMGLIYGGIRYTRRTTVERPRCGVRSAKYRVGQRECHPALADEDGPWHDFGN